LNIIIMAKFLELKKLKKTYERKLVEMNIVLVVAE
jgi:hypothetical protein